MILNYNLHFHSSILTNFFKSTKMASSIYELENLLIDPEYFLEEHFIPIIKKIDIKTEEGKIKCGEKAEEYNKEREKLLQELNDDQEKCKQLIKDGVFKEEIDKIKHYFDTFDSNNKEKLQENINQLKSILLRFHEYSVYEDAFDLLGSINST